MANGNTEIPTKAKQAVVVVHGQGEQRPMATLRAFAETVWVRQNPGEYELDPKKYRLWSKPDNVTGNLELRRLTTNSLEITRDDGPVRLRTDFFEFYWQHLMPGNQWSHFVTWIQPLIRTPFSSLPKALEIIWAPLQLTLYATILVGASLGLIALLAWARLLGANPIGVSVGTWLSAVMEKDYFWLALVFAGVLLVAAVLVVAVVMRFLVHYFGDAARYLNAEPRNVAARTTIRSELLGLLRTLQDHDDYTRIVLVGHSLGSVIAYDALSFLWSEYSSPKDQEGTSSRPSGPSVGGIAEVERAQHAARQVEDARKSGDDTQLTTALQAYEDARRHLAVWLQGQTPAWKITDFITLGSPLTYADILVATNPIAFNQAVDDRELPTSPPQLEQVRGERVFTYPHFKPGRDDADTETWYFHHAAVFAATKWTNLYFGVRNLVRGDILSGPVRRLFGLGVLDRRVWCDFRWGTSRHNRYWESDTTSRDSTTPRPEKALRDVLNLAQKEAPVSDTPVSV
ncbi:MAG: hypothetical protein AAF624_05125 [Bacteroidota bacterium]